MTLNFNETVRRDDGSLTDLKAFCKENGGDTTELEQDVEDLQTAVGNESSGLVKDVNTLKTDVSSLEDYLAGEGWSFIEAVTDSFVTGQTSVTKDFEAYSSAEDNFMNDGKEYLFLIDLSDSDARYIGTFTILKSDSALMRQRAYGLPSGQPNLFIVPPFKISSGLLTFRIWGNLDEVWEDLDCTVEWFSAPATYDITYDITFRCALYTRDAISTT